MASQTWLIGSALYQRRWAAQTGDGPASYRRSICGSSNGYSLRDECRRIDYGCWLPERIRYFFFLSRFSLRQSARSADPADAWSCGGSSLPGRIELTIGLKSRPHDWEVSCLYMCWRQGWQRVVVVSPGDDEVRFFRFQNGQHA